jgi:hypothetical protein
LTDNACAYRAQRKKPAKAEEFKKVLDGLKMKVGREPAFVILFLFIVCFFGRVFVGC